MSADPRKMFYSLIRDEFAPKLRELGFKGSGSHFRRIRGEVINTINIQGRTHGGSSAVNLGLHLTFLPVNWADQLPDLKTVKEIDCEFRNRLAPGGEGDYWWKYRSLLSASKNVAHLIDTYLAYGEPEFSKFDAVEKISNMIALDEIRADNYIKVFGGITAVRAALTMARIHRHLGNNDEAGAFAEAGLANLGRGIRVKPQLEEILDSL